MCHSIHCGNVSDQLAKRSPGKMFHARWLTKANRILRLYVSLSDPSENIKDLVTIILRVYAPAWFWIKSHPNVCEGAINFWYITKLLRDDDVKEQHKEIMKKVLKNNSYFAHPENVLLSMLADSRKQCREKAIQQVTEARQVTSDEVREFQLPQTLNLEAEDYVNMVNWESEPITSPQILRNVTNQDHLQLLMVHSQWIISCHSQGKERAVNLVTQAAQSRVNCVNRHKFILNVQESRNVLPTFD